MLAVSCPDSARGIASSVHDRCCASTSSRAQTLNPCGCTRYRALFSPGFTERGNVEQHAAGEQHIKRADCDRGAVPTMSSQRIGGEQTTADEPGPPLTRPLPRPVKSLEALPAAGESEPQTRDRAPAAPAAGLESHSPDAGGHEEGDAGRDIYYMEEQYVGHNLDRCLAHAVYTRNMTLVDELVSAGASVNRWLPRVDDDLCPNALAVAAGCGDSVAVAHLLELSADPSLSNDDGYTALHFAV
jgi:hypothetical protein